MVTVLPLEHVRRPVIVPAVLHAVISVTDSHDFHVFPGESDHVIHRILGFALGSVALILREILPHPNDIAHTILIHIFLLTPQCGS
jgi:hypothetical protein